MFSQNCRHLFYRCISGNPIGNSIAVLLLHDMLLDLERNAKKSALLLFAEASHASPPSISADDDEFSCNQTESEELGHSETDISGSRRQSLTSRLTEGSENEQKAKQLGKEVRVGAPQTLHTTAMESGLTMNCSDDIIGVENCCSVKHIAGSTDNPLHQFPLEHRSMGTDVDGDQMGYHNKNETQYDEHSLLVVDEMCSDDAAASPTGVSINSDIPTLRPPTSDSDHIIVAGGDIRIRRGGLSEMTNDGRTVEGTSGTTGVSVASMLEHNQSDTIQVDKTGKFPSDVMDVFPNTKNTINEVATTTILTISDGPYTRTVNSVVASSSSATDDAQLLETVAASKPSVLISGDLPFGTTEQTLRPTRCDSQFAVSHHETHL